MRPDATDKTPVKRIITNTVFQANSPSLLDELITLFPDHEQGFLRY